MSLTRLKFPAAFMAIGVLVSGTGAATPRASAAETTTLAVPERFTKEAPAAMAPADRETFDTKEKLVREYSKFEGFDDPKTTLEEALIYLTKRCDLDFDVNEKAFEADGLKDVLKAPIAEKPIPERKRFTATDLLPKLLDRLPAKSNAIWIVRGSRVEMTTQAAVRAEVGVAEDQPLLPFVYTVLSKRPLEEALQELATSTGVNVVLDARAGEKAKAAVTARLMIVPVDRAVRLLADMADLKAVLVGNVLYVTNKENAAQWEKEAAKLRPAKAEEKNEAKMSPAK